MAINFPNSPSIGDVFTDTTSGFSYEWTGTVWKSFSANTVSNIQILDDISSSFNNSLTTFNLTVGSSAVSPASAQQIEVILGGIQQSPGVDYTISGSTVVFTTAPTNGLTFSGKLLGTALSLNTIPAGADGSGLIGISSGFISAVGIQSGGTIIGTGITQLNFVGLNSVSQSASGTVNIDFIQTETELSAGSGSQRVVLTGQTSGSMTAAATDAELNYHSGTNTLSATTFSGALAGDASGSSGSCTGNSATATVATVATNAQGLTGTPDITIRNLTGVAATFTGVLTYEDVTNVDSVGVITARAGIKFGLAGVGGTITADGHAEFVGMCTANGVTSDGTALFKGGLAEKYEKAGTTLGSQTNNPLSDGNVILFDGNESGNKTINFTGVHSSIVDGQTVSFTVIITPNNSGRITAVQVDGQTPAGGLKWAGGSAPSAGASGQDVYTLQILKTGEGVTAYTVFGAAANYA